MATGNDPAEPIAKGIIATAKQSWGDLFRWKQRVIVTNELGESHTEWQSPEKLKNPISLFMQLSARDWIYFLVGLFAWTADAFDFHALAIQTVKLSKYYGKTKTDITTAITLTLLLRSVGAATFGLLGDRFGRKWPMVGNLVLLGKSSTILISSPSTHTLRRRSLANCHHLQRHVRTVPSRPITVWSVHGRRLRKCCRYGT